MKHRIDLFREALPQSERFREKQFLSVLFWEKAQGWNDATVFSKETRKCFEKMIPWMVWREHIVQESSNHDTYKVLLESIDDGAKIETVLMKNARDNWTVCVSSQIGCAMKCSFCATGALGFTRNLSDDEIVDQVRFWKYFLVEKKLNGVITNVVYMGMGEPLANYEEVRSSLRALIEYGEIGTTRITVSTVGLIPRLQMLLSDPLWPPVRLAISLHSADESLRKNLMPTSYDGFLEDLSAWVREYHKKFDGRRRHITFEYILLGGVNDTERHAHLLAKFAKGIGRIKVNVIPWNQTNTRFVSGNQGEVFVKRLQKNGVIATVRKSRGQDISAACGQLANQQS